MNLPAFEALEARVRAARLPVVCVQGLGFVGTAMAIAVANARDKGGRQSYFVVGIDLAHEQGTEKVRNINSGRLSLVSNDDEMAKAFGTAFEAGNLAATTDESAYALADVVVVDVHLDVDIRDSSRPEVDFSGFRRAIRTLGSHMRPGALVIVETTVPPGTCAHVVVPELNGALAERGLPPDSFLVAHSYERVMPGKDYFNSIVNFWRVYAGTTREAEQACERFLSSVINVRDYPLTRVRSTTASETAKVLENSYRATNIAFIEEWGRFAEAADIDLFEVIDAIRLRPTHSNMRQPGFGVGGYCLTKDPLLGLVGARQVMGYAELDFPFSRMAVEINARMPLVAVARLRDGLGGSLSGKRVLLLGVSYRQDVGDTRFSPSEAFVRAVEREGGHVECHDPLITEWSELGRRLPGEMPRPAGMDAVVFALPHREYQALDVCAWLSDERPLVLDANRVLTATQVAALKSAGHTLSFVGKGTPWPGS